MSGGFVYWADATAGSIQSVPIGGGTIQPVPTNQTDPSSVVVDSGGTLYWFAGGVMALPVGAATPTMLAPVPGVSGVPISASSGYVYWYTPSTTSGTFDGAVWRVPTSGGTAESIASQQGGIGPTGGGSGLVTDVAANANIVLYTSAGLLKGLDL